VHLVGRARRLAGLDEPGHSSQGGLRPWAWWERAVATTLADGLSAENGRRQLHAVVRSLGQPAPGLESWGLSHRFPTPSALTRDALQASGVDRQRAAAVATLAATVNGGLQVEPADPDLARAG
jgi:3-methyladenine DNA glycosylase/8-oxoguanine DNA glycosylase